MENLQYFFHAIYVHLPWIYGIWIIMHAVIFLLGGMPFRLVALKKGKIIGDYVSFSHFGYVLKTKWKFIFLFLITFVPVCGWWLVIRLVRINGIICKVEPKYDNIYISSGRGLQEDDGSLTEIQYKKVTRWNDKIWVIPVDSPSFQKYFNSELKKL